MALGRALDLGREALRAVGLGYLGVGVAFLSTLAFVDEAFRPISLAIGAFFILWGLAYWQIRQLPYPALPASPRGRRIVLRAEIDSVLDDATTIVLWSGIVGVWATALAASFLALDLFPELIRDSLTEGARTFLLTLLMALIAGLAVVVTRSTLIRGRRASARFPFNSVGPLMWRQSPLTRRDAALLSRLEDGIPRLAAQIQETLSKAFSSHVRGARPLLIEAAELHATKVGFVFAAQDYLVAPPPWLRAQSSSRVSLTLVPFLAVPRLLLGLVESVFISIEDQFLTGVDLALNRIEADPLGQSWMRYQEPPPIDKMMTIVAHSRGAQSATRRLRGALADWLRPSESPQRVLARLGAMVRVAQVRRGLADRLSSS